MSVFISYSTIDSGFVDKLCEGLVMKKIPIWRDKWEMKVGDSLIDKIQIALEDASFLLVVLSKNSIASNWCKKELNSGVMRELEENNVVVLPVLLEKCKIPIFLREKLYADFTKSFDAGFETLIKPLKKLVSEHIGRRVGEGQITDFAINWGIHPESYLFYTNIDIVTMQLKQERTVLFQVSVNANKAATKRHISNVDNGQSSLMKNTIIQTLLELNHLKNLVIRLSPDHVYFNTIKYKDSKSEIEFDIKIRCLMMGSDLGDDLLVYFKDFSAIIHDQISI